jgi:hypothetical protein
MKTKMTILSCTAVLFLLATGCATMMGTKATPEMRTYERIIEVPGQTKDRIYIKANSWFVETFNSAESVIEFQDKEAGKIMGKYVFSYAEGVYTYSVKQTVDISIKDDKVRVIINNPLYKITSGMGETYYNATYRPLETQKGVERARTEWTELTTSLDNYLQKDDEW